MSSWKKSLRVKLKELVGRISLWINKSFNDRKWCKGRGRDVRRVSRSYHETVALEYYFRRVWRHNILFLREKEGERGEGDERFRWNAKWYANVRPSVIVSGVDKLQAEDRTKLAESFVFFPSRKFRWNYFSVTSVNPARLPVKLFVIRSLGRASLRFVPPRVAESQWKLISR